MIIIMKPSATAAETEQVITRVRGIGLDVHLSQGEARAIIGVLGNTQGVDRASFEVMEGVEGTVRITQPFKVASREFKATDTEIKVGEVTIGGPGLVIMAGPCSVESRAQILETAHAVKAAGAHILRGGAYKPRSSPYSFQGLGEEGLQLLAAARAATGLPIVTEVMGVNEVPLVAEYADILQIGARNMQNYRLLQAVGKTDRPVFLKRGLSSTIQELLMSAEYILDSGNYNVILCERGIRTFETATRNTFDINAIPLLKQLSHLPVIGDPSHGVGKWDLVPAVAKAALAAGADGLMLEVHPQPALAWSDGAQSLKPERFAGLMVELRALAAALGKTL
ncbi:MAG: 3-deoxy-7-phosphoheptulonate synthase [Caldilineales bacterium]|nr:3-deoxy-7-phosphoheptulonate synthase [Caldilineales bacterium]